MHQYVTDRPAITSGLAAVIVCILLFLTYKWDRAWKEAYAASCVDNLKQIGLALLNYESVYESLPPSYVVDAQGNPLYSWRVVLAAYMGRESNETDGQILMNNFRFNERWDSSHNSKLHNMRPRLFFCPAQPKALRRGFSSYLAVVGSKTLFPPHGQTRRLSEIADAPRTTWMLVESQDSSIHWMEPRDLAWDDLSFRSDAPSRPSVSSNHRTGHHAGIHVVAADDSISYIHGNVDIEDVKAMFEINNIKPILPVKQ